MAATSDSRAEAIAPQTCRNCGAPVGGAYCATCGQETALRLPTLREFLREAAGRYVALDGRFWRTVLALLARPGFLTREYLAGRRRSPALQKRWNRFNNLSKSEKAEQLGESILRYAPYAMLVLLPAFALLLKLVYLGASICCCRCAASTAARGLGCCCGHSCSSFPIWCRSGWPRLA